MSVRHFLFFMLLSVGVIQAQNTELLKITLSETANLDRSLEYIEFFCQLNFDTPRNGQIQLMAENLDNKERIPCQVSGATPVDTSKTCLMRILFPVSMPALGKKEFRIIKVDKANTISSGLAMQGVGLERIIENEYYRADLTKNIHVEPQSHNSGQIREILIKWGINQLVTNIEDRVHWAPNFDRPEIEWYTTIAHWNFPKTYQVEQGPYKIRTIRQDGAPGHPEIFLTAVYNFYDRLPFFKFYSSMEIQKGVWLQLLRNDEMAMDSMFTHLAFKWPSGEIIDIPFSEMRPLIDKQPIENDSPWLCFYNKDKGFALGSIRILYDNTNSHGDPSVLYKPHTQIGEWLKGIKYWNRRLIHDQLTYVPAGSIYREENAYLVFKTAQKDHLRDIQYWADRLRHPLHINIEYPN